MPAKSWKTARKIMKTAKRKLRMKSKTASKK